MTDSAIILPFHYFVTGSEPAALDHEILGGTPVFVGTRVPVESLLDHLQAGDSIDDFLEGFPSVRREQVITLIDEFRKAILQAD